MSQKSKISRIKHKTMKLRQTKHLRLVKKNGGMKLIKPNKLVKGTIYYIESKYTTFNINRLPPRKQKGTFDELYKYNKKSYARFIDIEDINKGGKHDEYTGPIIDYDVGYSTFYLPENEERTEKLKQEMFDTVIKNITGELNMNTEAYITKLKNMKAKTNTKTKTKTKKTRITND